MDVCVGVNFIGGVKFVLVVVLMFVFVLVVGGCGGDTQMIFLIMLMDGNFIKMEARVMTMMVILTP